MAILTPFDFPFLSTYLDLQISELLALILKFEIPKLSKYLTNFADDTGMKYNKYNLEFFGLCKKCKKS